MHKTKSSVSLVVSFVFISTLMAAIPALAGNFGSTYQGFCNSKGEGDWPNDPCNNVNLANNSSHSVYMVPGLRSDLEGSTEWQMLTDYNNGTQLQVWEDSNDSADVLVMDNDYGDNGLAGWVVCPNGAATGGSFQRGWCYGQYLRYNLHYPGSMNTSAERAHLTCHELGHTVGLRHEGGGLSSCMRNDTYAYSDLTQHDESHINDWYS